MPMAPMRRSPAARTIVRGSGGFPRPSGVGRRPRGQALDGLFRGTGLSALLLLLSCILPFGQARAGDILTHVPSDTAGLISIRNLAELAGKLSGFSKRLDPGATGLDIAEIEMLFGLEPRTIDASRPIHVLLRRPGDLLTFFHSGGLGEGDDPFPIVAFTAKNPADFAGALGACPDAEQRRAGPFGDYWVLRRDDLVFVSEKLRPLRHVRGTTPDRSLAATIDARSRALSEESDVFIYLPMDRWRARISPFVLIAVNVMKMKMTADQSAEECRQMEPLLSWSLGGLQRLIDEMQSISVGLDFDGTTFRLTHAHAYRPDGAVAAYLRQVRRIDQPLGQSLPDRPFFALGLIQWRIPVELSVTKRLCDAYFAADCPGAKSDQQIRQRLRESMLFCADQLQGMEFMLTSPPGRLLPAQVLGSDVVADAPAALDKYRFVQENAGELMSAMVCGGAGSFGTFKAARCGDDHYLELDLTKVDLPESSRRQMCEFYGQGVRYQQGAAGRHHLAYALAAPPGGVGEVFETLRSGRNISKNPEVARIRSRLPQDAHAVVIVDIGRVLRLVPYLAEGLRQNADEHRPDPANCLPNTGPGPLIGWSCTVAGDAISCRLAVDAADVAALVETVSGGPSVDP